MPDAHAFADVLADPPSFRDIAKRAVAVVQKELVRLPFVNLGWQ